MPILVAFASKHGATQGIAERIAERLMAGGRDARVLPVSAVDDPGAYSAFVIGSAVYLGKWRKEASEFVRHNQGLLSTRPVWLFSSGPLGPETVDDKGRDVIEIARPAEYAEFTAAIAPRDLKVFYGALDPATRDGVGWLLRRVPAGRALLPEGDFRDWATIEAWAEGISDGLLAIAR